MLDSTIVLLLVAVLSGTGFEDDTVVFIYRGGRNSSYTTSVDANHRLRNIMLFFRHDGSVDMLFFRHDGSVDVGGRCNSRLAHGIA